MKGNFVGAAKVDLLFRRQREIIPVFKLNSLNDDADDNGGKCI